MTDILCLYVTRTGYTEKLCKKIAKKLCAEMAEISDGKDYGGKFGFVKGIFRTYFVKNKLIQLPKTKKRLREYEKIYIFSPIWCEQICPIAKDFTVKYKDEFAGDVYFVLTHDSEIPYTNRIEKMYKLIGKPKRSHLSLQKEKVNASEEELDELLKELR